MVQLWLLANVLHRLNMPHVFIHAEYADMVFVYGHCNGNAVAACAGYDRLFPNRRVPDSWTLTRVFTNLRETGAAPSSRISSDRVNEQNMNEVEDIIQSVERNSSTCTHRISARIGVPHSRICTVRALTLSFTTDSTPSIRRGRYTIRILSLGTYKSPSNPICIHHWWGHFHSWRYQ